MCKMYNLKDNMKPGSLWDHTKTWQGWGPSSEIIPIALVQMIVNMVKKAKGWGLTLVHVFQEPS